MRVSRLKPFALGILCLFVFSSLSISAQPLSVKEVLEKNLQAGGGEEKISQINNFSFKDGRTTYYVSPSGQMKVTSGKKPVITEVILIDNTQVKRNCYQKITTPDPLVKHTLENLAKWYSGLFTIKNYEGELKMEGIKKFGPKEHYLLSSESKDFSTEFYIDSEDFLVKRVVFSGYQPDTGKYEVNHDLGPYQEVEGIKIPTSWFSSRIGSRGSQHQLSSIEINLDLGENFFKNYDINVGKTEWSEGILKGNVVEYSMGRGNRIMISTNWTNECIQRAGFKSTDKLLLTIGGSELEVNFYSSQPPRTAYIPGRILMMPNRGDENYVILILASEGQDLVETLDPLLPIHIKKHQ